MICIIEVYIKFLEKYSEFVVPVTRSFRDFSNNMSRKELISILILYFTQNFLYISF